MKLLKKILSIGRIFSLSKKNAEASDKTAKPNKGERKNGSRRRLNAPQNGGRPKTAGSAKPQEKSRRRSKNAKARDIAGKIPPAKIPEKSPPQPYEIGELMAAIPEFAAFDLGAQTLSAVKDMGYSQPTPIQSSAIPEILNGSDLIATAQTGTARPPRSHCRL